MAPKKPFNNCGTPLNGHEIMYGMPLVANNQEYGKLLTQHFDPGLPGVLAPLNYKLLMNMGRAQCADPYLISGQLPPGPVSGGGLFSAPKAYERDFAQYAFDISVPGFGGRHINVMRANIPSEEDFSKLQKEGRLSAHAMWTGDGMYMLNGMMNTTRFKNGANIAGGKTDVFEPFDPYGYLAHAKFKTENGQPDGKVVRDPKTGLAIISNRGDPELEKALRIFSPEMIGLPLDPSRQKGPLPQGNATFTPQDIIAEHQKLQGVRPGQPAPATRPQDGPNIRF